MSGPARQLPAASDALYLPKEKNVYYIVNNLCTYKERVSYTDYKGEYILYGVEYGFLHSPRPPDLADLLPKE